jgi:hypothetical protein
MSKSKANSKVPSQKKKVVSDEEAELYMREHNTFKLVCCDSDIDDDGDVMFTTQPIVYFNNDLDNEEPAYNHNDSETSESFNFAVYHSNNFGMTNIKN